MFKIDSDGTTIKLNRGTSGSITFGALDSNGSEYQFMAGDVIRLNVTRENRENAIVMSIDTIVNENCYEVILPISSFDSQIGFPINKPTKFWYDIELNPDSPNAQMLLGYDENGPKYLILYPESVKEEF